MNKSVSPRNKTIKLSIKDQELYSSKSITVSAQVATDTIIDKTICDDTLHAALLLPDNFVDLLIVDPPYNMTKTFGENTFHKLSSKAYSEFTISWLNAVKHTLKSTASIYVCCDWYSSMVIGDILNKEYIVRNRITWQREKGRGCNTNWKNSSEDIWYATVSNSYTFHPEAVKLRRKVIAPYKENGNPKDWQYSESGSFRDTYPSNFWDDISVPFWSMPENTPHPAQKPEKLIAKLILASTNKNDTVLDPFMGSGTVPVVAKKLSRHYIGIEREKTYCAYAEKRLENASLDTRIQGYEDNVFWERNASATQKKKGYIK